MLVSLPRNYNQTARFPLLVYLAGGSGGAITRRQLAYVRKLTGDEDFVSATMPLFKRTYDAEEPGGADNIGAYDDYPLMARCYRTMLRALFTAIPNIDPEGSAFGGFSNGAHVTEMLVSAVDPFILKHFGGFYLLDGGFIITSLYRTAVRRKRFVYFIGGSRREKLRRHLLACLDVAYRRHQNIAMVEMPGVGHAFPDGYIPQLRRWLYSLSSAGQGQSSAHGKPRR